MEENEILRNLRTLNPLTIGWMFGVCSVLQELGYDGNGQVIIDAFTDNKCINHDLRKLMDDLFDIKIPETGLIIEPKADQWYYPVNEADKMAYVCRKTDKPERKGRNFHPPNFVPFEIGL